MQRSSATIHVTKPEAARRQLDAAIRMFFSGEDELAVHTVAGAAWKILLDIKGRRGADDEFDTFASSVLALARSHARDEVPAQLAAVTRDHPEFRNFIESLSDQIRTIGVDTSIKDLQAALMTTNAKGGNRRQWEKFAEELNFLKHADRDAYDTVNLDKINNSDLISHAFRTYTDIFPKMTVEGFVFLAAETAKTGAYDEKTSNEMIKFLNAAAHKIAEVAADQQNACCLRMIIELKSDAAFMKFLTSTSKK